MTLLKDILYKVRLREVSGDMESPVRAITIDSRTAAPGSVFIAIKGLKTDGHEFIGQALDRGAKAVVCQKMPVKLNENVAYVIVEDPASALGVISGNFFGNPSHNLVVVGVTGTNGKTTTATLLFDLFLKLGYKSGLISTVDVRIDEEILQTTHTTPDAITLHGLFQQMVKAGCTHVFMEVSSHAIHQGRVIGIDFDGAIFTNISHDHLDYHKTFEDYIKVKKQLFDQLKPGAFALTNVDDRRGRIMLQNTKAKKYTYSLRGVSDFKAKVVSNSFDGLELIVEGHEVWFKLIGDFNAYNLLAVFGAAKLLGENVEDTLTVLSEVLPAPGRFEMVRGPNMIVAIVDYAHTPDALRNVLETIQTIRTGNERVITVVGCGGDRDKEKRPKMAAVACLFSDHVIFTSDNPRSEKPKEVIKDMQAGVGPLDYKKTTAIVDREQAIKSACTMAKDGDIILVAGKGHETYQEIGGDRLPFDDREVLAKMFDQTSNQE